MTTSGPTEIVGGTRSSFGRFGGAHAKAGAVDLGIRAMQALLDQAKVPKDSVGRVFLGNAVGVDKILARQVTLLGGLDPAVTSMTVDRACCSAMSALSLGDMAVQSGVDGVVLAGGSECMSAVPHFIHGARWAMKMGPGQMEDPLLLADPTTDSPAAVDAADIAVEYGVDRVQQDEWAVASHERYFAALDRGFFDGEIFDLDRSLPQPDEQPRRGTNMEALGGLRTVFGSKTVTAGNAPGLNDGAVMLALASPAVREKLGLSAIARIVATAEVASHSKLIASIPGDAIAAVLAKTGWSVDDVHLFEINEAFAAVPLVASHRLDALAPNRKTITNRLNVNGGAVAIGHPVGASGARLVLTLVRALVERGGGRGVAAICGGSGQGDAVAVEVG